MLIPDRLEIGWSKELVSRVFFWSGVPDISHKNKDARETVVFWVYVWPFWGSDGAPNGWEW